MKKVIDWFKKNWRWLLPTLVFVGYAVIPNKTFGEMLGFLAGGIFIGFIWYAWTHYLKGKV